jgi:glc operon protein GlcG
MDMGLTHQFALETVIKALDAAKGRGTAVAAVVVDTGGRVVVSVRMDGTSYLAASIAQRKAATSAGMGGPTMMLGDFMRNDPKLASLLSDPELCMIPGGVPIIMDGAIVGGLGISGGHYSADQEIATAAVGGPTGAMPGGPRPQ